MARHFFTDEDQGQFLEEFGVRISWIDKDGALKGTEECPVYGQFIHNVTNERDDTGGMIAATETLLLMKTVDAKQMTNNSEVTIAEPPGYDEKWLAIKTASEIISDGDLTSMPVQPL